MAYYGSGTIKERVIWPRQKADDNLCPRGVYILVERDKKEMKKIKYMMSRTVERKKAREGGRPLCRQVGIFTAAPG